MRKEIAISLMPMASFGDTPYAPIVDAWCQANLLIKNHPFILSGKTAVDVTLDASNVIDLLESCRLLDEGDDERFNQRLKQWTETRDWSSISIAFDGPEDAIADNEHIAGIALALIQELFLALNLSAAGAGHLNAAHCNQLGDQYSFAYYGDSLESAWCEARKWGWPKLSNIPFAETWNWLREVGFRDCWLAKEASHKALIALLECGRSQSHGEVEEVLMIARAIEALIGGDGINIGRALKRRIAKILDEPTTHKGWLADFYSLRSRIAHGDYPLIRPGFEYRDADGEIISKLWKPLDQSKAVVLSLLQDLIAKRGASYGFEEVVLKKPLGA